MSNKFFKLIVIVVVLFIIAIQQGRLGGRDFPFSEETPEIQASLPEISLEQATKIFPEAHSIQPADTSVFLIFDKEKQKLGRALLSSPYTDKIIGFSGPVPLLIGIDNQEKIIAVSLLHNTETPEYVNQTTRNGLLSQWDGLSKAEAMEKKVDAVSGATFTSNAIVKTVQKRLSVDLQSDLQTAFSWNAFLKNTVVILILILALYCFFRPGKTKKLRILLLALSVLLLGFWQGTMLSLAQFFSWLTNGIPLPVQIGTFLIFLAAILLPFFTGRAFYCAYVCPFGAAQELVGKAGKKKIRISPKVLHYLLILRKAILIAVALLLIFGLNFNLSYVEPFSVFNISVASVITILIAVVSLILSLFINRPWCRFCCPTGQLLDLFRK